MFDSEKGSVKYMGGSFWSKDLTELFTPVTKGEATYFKNIIDGTEVRHNRVLTTREVKRITELFLKRK